MSGFRVWAALDLMGGKAVRLRRGDPATAWVVAEDPLGQALAWQEQGASAFHLVDLDAALGQGTNRALVAALCRQLSVPVQVGGGVRDEASYWRWREAGASRVVVGSWAVRNPEQVAALAARDPEGLVVAADANDGKVLCDGWQQASLWPVARFARRMRELGCRHLLVTAVRQDGTGEGPDVSLLRVALDAFGQGVLASGGVANATHLRALVALAEEGLEGVVVGTALASGSLTFAEIGLVVGG